MCCSFCDLHFDQNHCKTENKKVIKLHAGLLIICMKRTDVSRHVQQNKT